MNVRKVLIIIFAGVVVLVLGVGVRFFISKQAKKEKPISIEPVIIKDIPELFRALEEKEKDLAAKRPVLIETTNSILRIDPTPEGQSFLILTDKETGRSLQSVTTDVGGVREQLRQLEGARLVQDSYLVELKEPAPRTKEEVDSLLNKARKKFNSIGDIEIKQTYRLSLVGFAVKTSAAKAEKIRNLDYVKRVEKDVPVFSQLNDSVPQIGAPSVWSKDANGNDCSTSGNPCLTGLGVTIAIIDTGVDYTHPDLGGCLGPTCKVIGGYDLVNNDSDPMDDMGHGTHVAATAAGKDSAGVYNGVAPDADIFAYKVLNNVGAGTFTSIIGGIERALDPNQDGNLSDKVDVINLSLGGTGDPEDPMAQAVDAAVDNGVVVVVAAGNGGNTSQKIASPGVAKKAITVGASVYTSIAGNGVISFSSAGPVLYRGSVIVKPDILAPGVSVCAAQFNNYSNDSKCNTGSQPNRVSISGTSMATPMVAGAVAILRQLYPQWSVAKIKSSIKNNAEVIKEYPSNLTINPFRVGNGVIKVDKASKARVFINPEVLNFGVLDQSKNPWVKKTSVLIENTHPFDITFNLSKRMDSFRDQKRYEQQKNNSNILLNFPNSVTIPSNSVVSVDFNLETDVSIETGIYSNDIIFMPDNTGSEIETVNLPIVFLKTSPFIELNREATKSKIDINVIYDYPPESVQFVVTEPGGNEKPITIDQKSPRVWSSTFQPEVEGVNRLTVRGIFEDAMIYNERTFIFDKTPPQLTQSIDNNGEFVISANEDIGPNIGGFKFFAKFSSDFSYSLPQIIKKDKDRVLAVAVEGIRAGDFIDSNRLVLFEYIPTTDNIIKTNLTEPRKFFKGFQFIQNKNGDIYLLVSAKGPTLFDEILLFRYEPNSKTIMEVTNIYNQVAGSAGNLVRINALVDKDDNLNIFFTKEVVVCTEIVCSASSSIIYKKVDFNGTTLINATEIEIGSNYLIKIDSDGFIDIFVASRSGTNYKRIDSSNGSVIDTGSLPNMIIDTILGRDDEIKILGSGGPDRDDNRDLYISSFDRSTKSLINEQLLVQQFSLTGLLSDRVLSAKKDISFNFYLAYFVSNRFFVDRLGVLNNARITTDIIVPLAFNSLSDFYIDSNQNLGVLNAPALICSFCSLVRDVVYYDYNFLSARNNDTYFPTDYISNNTYVISGIDPSVDKNILVTATDLAGNESTLIINPQAPEAPSNLYLKGNKIYWQDNSQIEDRFEIYGSTDGYNFDFIATTRDNENVYQVGPASEDKEVLNGGDDSVIYTYYRVRACFDVACSGYSNIAPPYSNQPPSAVAQISLDGITYSNAVTVSQGVPVSVYLSASDSSDSDGWTSSNGVSSGGKCEWNTDLNQDPATYEQTVSDPAAPSACNVYLGQKTFNDLPGTYTYTVLKVTDSEGLSNEDTVQVTVNLPPDNAPPIRSNGSPSGALQSGTTQATLSLQTNETATCKYGPASASYDSLPNVFSGAGSTNHMSSVSSLADGTTYSYYVRCQDGQGNTNTSDYLITFSIVSTPPILTDPACVNSGTLVDFTKANLEKIIIRSSGGVETILFTPERTTNSTIRFSVPANFSTGDFLELYRQGGGAATRVPKC